MNKYQLSILIAGIRPQNWLKLYQSIEKSFSGSWEIIFVGPYPLPTMLEKFDNIQYREDWGSPIRGLQIALTMARGGYISIAADDGIYLENSLDDVFEMIKKKGYAEKYLVIGKYFEGPDGWKTMNHPVYYLLNFHDGARSKWIPNHCMLMNMMVVPKKLLWDLGGWDCEFEVPAMALCDLAVRVSLCKDVEMEISPKAIYYCNYMVRREGDHGPIHDAQTDVDMPRFKRIWDGEIMPVRDISLNNWELAPDRWVRRFGEA